MSEIKLPKERDIVGSDHPEKYGYAYGWNDCLKALRKIHKIPDQAQLDVNKMTDHIDDAEKLANEIVEQYYSIRLRKGICGQNELRQDIENALKSRDSYWIKKLDEANYIIESRAVLENEAYLKGQKDERDGIINRLRDEKEWEQLFFKVYNHNDRMSRADTWREALVVLLNNMKDKK